MTTYIGIDPGQKGAIAFISGKRVAIFSMPYIGKGKGSEVDSRGLWVLIRQNVRGEVFVV